MVTEKLGDKYYRVEHQGTLSMYEVVGFKNDEPLYGITQLAYSKNDEYIYHDNPERFGTSNFSINKLKSREDYFDNLNEAKKEALKRFEKQVNPNGDYKVARYFDDVFEAYVTDVLTKTEANKKALELNKMKPRHYVRYSIRMIANP